jgi:PAS domain S-box-containing protein
MLSVQQAEPSRSDISARLAALVQSSGDAIIGETLDGIITDWNPAAERLYGYTPTEIIGHHLTMVVPPERMAETEALLARVHQGESIEGIETVRIRKDGRMIDVALTISPVWDESGRIIATSAIVRDVTAVKANARALADSERRFRTAFTNAPIGMTLVGPDGRILQANAAFCVMLGYDQTDVECMTFQQLTYPEDLELNLRLMGSVLAGERDTYEMEKRYRHRNGALVWAHIRVSLVRSDDGAPQYLITHIQDITARKEAETALARERDLLRTVMDHVPDALYVKDVNSRFLRLNPSGARTLGIADPEEGLGKTDFDFFPEALARRYFADEQQVIASGQPLLNRLEPQSEDEANAAWWLTSTAPIRDETGTIVGIVGSGRDITERLHTEAALRESEARLRALLAALPDLMFRLDRDGIIVDYKADRLDDLMVPPEAFLGRTVSETLPPDVAGAITAAMERVLGSGTSETVEYGLELPRGWGEFEARLVAAGPDEVVAIVRNVTERKQAEEALRTALDAAQSANRTRRQFLAMMSHELRTPMQAILGYSELLVAQLAGSLTPDQMEDFAHIRDSAGRLITLVNQILDLSRLEAGGLELAMQRVDLTTIIEQVEEDVAPQAEAKGIALAISPTDHLPAVTGDATRLRQILLNLVGNAVKFTDDGAVQVSMKTSEDEIAVMVKDTGIGIAPDVLPYIFDEFRQADSGVTRRYTGAGLGLTIAKKLAEQHGGRISVTSQPNHGSTFTLHLPATGTTVPVANHGLAVFTSD